MRLFCNANYSNFNLLVLLPRISCRKVQSNWYRFTTFQCVNLDKLQVFTYSYLLSTLPQKVDVIKALVSYQYALPFWTTFSKAHDIKITFIQNYHLYSWQCMNCMFPAEFSSRFVEQFFNRRISRWLWLRDLQEKYNRNQACSFLKYLVPSSFLSNLSDFANFHGWRW